MKALSSNFLSGTVYCAERGCVNTLGKVSTISAECHVEAMPGGGTPRKIGWGCAARFRKPLPCFRPKFAVFPTLFQI